MRTKGTATELEIRRQIGGRLLLQGKRLREVAEACDVDISSVKRWKAAVLRSGLEALAAKDSPGGKASLSEAQREKLREIVLAGPLNSGYKNDLWTCGRVAEVIEKRFGIKYHPSHVWKILRRLDFSCQEPEQKAREQDEDEVRRWRRYKWPAIKRRAREGNLPLVFLDEFGMMLQPTRRRTWALKGHTPIQKAWARHDRISGLGALRVTPIQHRLTFYVQLFRENIVTEDMIWFLMQMHWHFHRKAILIWDGWSVHLASTHYFQREHPDWFEFEELPGYSPELNPVEQCWKHTKYDDLPNFIPEDIDHLYAEATRSLDSLHGDEEFLRSAFAYCGLPI